MHKLTLATLAVCVLALPGCVRTSTTMLSPGLEPRARVSPEEVRIFIDEKDIPGPYEKIALINAEGASGWTNEDKMIQTVRKKAASLGANGVLIENIQEPSAGAKVAAAVFGTSASRHGKAIAIYFRTRTPGSAPVPAVTTQRSTSSAAGVTRDRAWLQMEPDPTSKVVAGVPARAEVEILEDRGEWLLISWGEFRGYVPAKDIDRAPISG